MRKIIVIIGFALAVFLCCLPKAAALAANNTPHVVISGDNIWFLDADGVRLFLLPDTYYIKINNLDEGYYYCTFNGVSGKVDKTLVGTSGYHTTAPGTSRELALAESFINFVGAFHLKASPGSSVNTIDMPGTSSFTYLGSYPASSGVWYYVKYNGYYGYIPASMTNTPMITVPIFSPEQPEDVPVIAPPSEEGGGGGILPADNNTLKIVLIAGLCLPAIVIIFLLFRAKK